jgi:hypothetical protein
MGTDRSASRDELLELFYSSHSPRWPDIHQWRYQTRSEDDPERCLHHGSKGALDVSGPTSEHAYGAVHPYIGLPEPLRVLHGRPDVRRGTHM